MDKHIGPPLPISSLRLLFSPVRLMSGAIWHTVQHNIVSDYGMLEEFVSMVTDIVPELLSTEQKTQLLQGLRARNGFPEEFGRRYDDALVNVTWQFLSRLEKLFPLQTIQQVSFMLADIPSALEECLKSVSHRGELQTLLGCRKELLDVRLDKNGCPLDGAQETSALHLCAGDDVKAEEGHQAHSLPDVHAYGSQIEGQHASTVVTMSEEMEMAVENEAIEGTRHQELMDVFDKDCRVLLKRLENVPSVQRRPVRSNRGLKMKRILLHEKNARMKMTSKQILPRPQTLALEPSIQSSIDTFPSVTYTIVADDDADSVNSLDDPSYVAPIGSSSMEDSLSDCSDTYHSFMELASPREGKKPLVTAKKQDTLKIRLAAANTTSTYKALCFICKKHVQMDIKEHMKTHFPDGVLTCPRCDTLFKNMASLRLHFKRICIEQLQIEPGEDRVGQGLFKCDECVKSYRYKLSLDGHKRTHNQLYCEVCRRVLRDAKTLARHQVSHTPFQCTLCENNFGIFKHLSRHYENIHKLSTPYKCHHCPKVFSKLRFFIRHEWQHTGQLPFQCSQCSMKFKQDADLVVHLRVHTHEKPYLCADCGKTFSCNSNLRRHVKFRHSESRETRRFPCSQCNKTFKEKGALQKHEQRKHQNQKKARHPCMYCGKMFSQSGMARHKMIHTGEKPLKCQIPDCDQRFRSPSEVKNHVLRHHTADRPFECDTCGKGFIRASILNDHMKIHSGEKDHVCLVCGKAFLKLYSMTRHIQLMHTPK